MRKIIFRFAIPLLTLLALMVAFTLWPSRAGMAAAGIFILGLGISVATILRRQYQAYRSGGIDGRKFVLNSLLEIVGLLLALTLSMFLVRPAVAYLAGKVSGISGFVLAMLAAILAGAIISRLVGSTWGQLVGKPAKE